MSGSPIIAGNINPSRDGDTTARDVRRVLWVVLALNVAVAAAKIAWGLASRSSAMYADGFHSLFDGTSNVIALVGIALAARPADESHPYGHSKYETYSAVAIGAMLLFAAYNIGTQAIDHITGGVQHTEVSAISFAVMVGTLAVNFVVTTYERRAGKRLGSEVLLADADHTASDIFVSLGVIVSLGLVQLGFGAADGIVSLIIAGVIVYTALGVLRRASQTLSDSARIPIGDITSCVEGVPGVLSSHHVRTRGTDSNVLVDLHLVVPASITVAEGHDVATSVEDAIRTAFPQVADVVIHIEPEGAEIE